MLVKLGRWRDVCFVSEIMIHNHTYTYAKNVEIMCSVTVYMVLYVLRERWPVASGRWPVVGRGGTRR